MYFVDPVPLVYTTVPPPGPVSPTTQVPPLAHEAGAAVVDVVVVDESGPPTEPVKIAPVSVAPVKFALVKTALVKLAFVKLAPVKFASARFAPVKLALSSDAPSKPTADESVMLLMLTFVMVALVNIAPLVTTPTLNWTPTNEAEVKSAPEMSD